MVNIVCFKLYMFDLIHFREMLTSASGTLVEGVNIVSFALKDV